MGNTQDTHLFNCKFILDDFLFASDEISQAISQATEELLDTVTIPTPDELMSDLTKVKAQALLSRLAASELQRIIKKYRDKFEGETAKIQTERRM